MVRPTRSPYFPMAWIETIAPHPLRSPFWRIVILTAMVSPLAIAVWVGRWGRSFPLPPCLFQWALGFPSPSCGLTRSVLALVSGDWARSLSYHLFGPVFVALAIAIALASVTEMLTRRSLAHWYERVWQSRATVGMIALCGLYYGLRLWVRYAPPPLPWGLGDTALWQQFVAGAIAL